LDRAAVQIIILDVANENLTDFIVLEAGIKGRGVTMATSLVTYSANAFKIFSQLAITMG